MKLEKSLQVSRLLDVYGCMLSKNQISIMKDYYFDDKTLTEIGENCNISRQAVLDTIKKSEEKLFEFEQKLKIVENLDKINHLINHYKQTELSKNDFVEQLENLIEEF